MTISDLAANYDTLRPVRGNLRVAFDYFRVQPTGIVRSAEMSGPDRVELTLSMGPHNCRKYVFSEPVTSPARSRCWVWGPADEKAPVAGAGA